MVTNRQWPDFTPHRKVHQRVLWRMDHHGCDKGGDGKFYFHICLLITLVKENQEVFPKWLMSLEILCHCTISYNGQTLASVSCHSNCVILLSATLVTLGSVSCHNYCVILLSTTLVTLGSVPCCNYCVIWLYATLVTLGLVPCCNYCVIYQLHWSDSVDSTMSQHGELVNFYRV